jgi:C1A family cysteine protease
MKFFRCIWILLLSVNALAQVPFGLGLVIDSAKYSAVPQNTKLMRGDYAALPEAISLRKYAPVPGYQGSYGTCAGWSTAYAARTILEAEKYDLSPKEIDKKKFSPSFVYNQIRLGKDCKSGTYLTDALDVLKKQGGLFLSEFEYDCDRQVNDTDRQVAKERTIIDYRLIGSKNKGNTPLYIKKSLSELKPVVIAMEVPNSFFSSGELWQPDSSDYKVWNQGHAITVIGYDDKKFGGAFELINSWGNSWGKDGFCWIKYSDMDYFCKYAYEMIDYSIKDTNVVDISGAIQFKENNNQIMQAEFTGKSFVTRNQFPTGTLFEVRISNNSPAYVYAFSCDTTNEIINIFPQNEKVSAFLPYSKNNIAIPDEDSYMELDTVKGISYYCFLYSLQPLSMPELIRKMSTYTGSVKERLFLALEDKVVNFNNVKYSWKDKIKFEGKSKGRSVLPVILELRHK